MTDESPIEVLASFSIAGSSFTDVNPLAREMRVSGLTIVGVRPANADQSTMHAEFGAMFRAYQQGVRGGVGVLVVQGLPVCTYCKGDLKALARAMGLERLTVHDADGNVIEFSSAADLLPIRNGGKAWR